MSTRKATLVGLLSILLWSANIGLVSTVTKLLGTVGGGAILHTGSVILLCFAFGFPKLTTFPRRYLYLASILFCIYETCFVLSLGFATSPRQTLELGMINYTWPSMTILMAIIFNRQKANILIVPGIALAFLGVCLVLGGDEGFSFADIAGNIMENPLSYGLSFIGAFFWSVYCTITSRMGKGKNGITFFFLLVTIILWIQFFVTCEQFPQLSMPAILYLVLACAALAFGYAAWNIGMLCGNVTVLATASYFIPILSSLLTTLIVKASLSLSFWQGCVITSIGSFLCWLSTRKNHDIIKSPEDKKSG
jgi:Permeases of the drug/metabolite transporter (DMT) superfamily